MVIFMRIAICDDEKEIRTYMARNIRFLYEDAEILLFEDGKSLLDYTEQIDILFLDIQMQEMDGLTVARELRKAKNTVTIIFVTAIEEYVFQAFDVGAFHYLVKPFDQAKFFEVLRKAAEGRKEISQKEKREEEGILIKKGAVTRRIYLSEIIYLEVFNRIITLHTAGEDIEFYGKLMELEKSLGDRFVRCHRSYIVNLRYVLKYDATGITLDNGTKVLLAKQKYAEFVKCYMKYINSLIDR